MVGVVAMWNPFRMFAEHDYRWNELDKVLTGAFKRISSDKSVIVSWLKHFRKKELENEENVKEINRQLFRQQVRIESLERSILDLKSVVESQKSGTFPYQVRTKSVPESEPVSEPAMPSRFISRVVSMIRPQRKEYVLQKILDMVEKESHATKQVETVIVKEKGLCGRTAFYDYLRELKHKNLIKQERKNDRIVLISTRN